MDITWIGTATVLLRIGPFTILTDPNFLHAGQRAWLGKGLWSRRLTDPAMHIAELPPLDLVVLSHVHGDHWDRVARRGLDRDVPIATTRQSARKLRLQGFPHAIALETWQTHEVRKDGELLTVTSCPGRHARGPAQAVLPHVMGTVLQHGGKSIYLTGDTLLIDELRELPRRFPAVDVGIWHLGGTRVFGMLVTMDGPQGADLLELVQPTTCLPVHHGDYGVFKDPVETFHREVQRRGLAGVRPIRRGETVSV